MSYHVFFDFSVGLSGSLKVPKGTFDAILTHVREVESTLGLETEQYRDNPPHWVSKTPRNKVSDKVYCEIASRHNDWVRRLYHQFGEWSANPVAEGEDLTPEQGKTFWHALTDLDVPAERWTADYYRERHGAPLRGDARTR